jgi:release factor glutamine methyltransferase
MLTLLEVIKKTTEFFGSRGISSPRLNAELLVGHALGLKRMQLYLQFERLLEERELELIRPLVRRRGRLEPIQYITGEAEFHGLNLKVDSRVLIPRPETEQLVELAVQSLTNARSSILDLGTGSGAIALALARQFPLARVTATDRDSAALTVARENASRAGVADRIFFVESDWFTGLAASNYDLIVSNPPYLSAEELAQVPEEVRGYEPAHALVAADGGMADYERIIPAVPEFLSTDGVLLFETGESQHEKIFARLRDAGFATMEGRQDLAGRPRFVIARRG